MSTMGKIIPVVVINDIIEVKEKLKALMLGGINTAEITFRTVCAKDAIAIAVKEFPDMTIGAGTVINAEQCIDALNAGAQFIVSPGLCSEVAKICNVKSVPYYPGCVTPTEIMSALSLGLTVLKFFPANVYGGLSALKALSAPFPQVRFIPTGGIDNSNLKAFLEFDRVFAVGGSWMMKDNISEISKEAVRIVRSVVV